MVQCRRSSVSEVISDNSPSDKRPSKRSELDAEWRPSISSFREISDDASPFWHSTTASKRPRTNRGDHSQYPELIREDVDFIFYLLSSNENSIKLNRQKPENGVAKTQNAKRHRWYKVTERRGWQFKDGKMTKIDPAKPTAWFPRRPENRASLDQSAVRPMLPASATTSVNAAISEDRFLAAYFRACPNRVDVDYELVATDTGLSEAEVKKRHHAVLEDLKIDPDAERSAFMKEPAEANQRSTFAFPGQAESQDSPFEIESELEMYLTISASCGGAINPDFKALGEQTGVDLKKAYKKFWDSLRKRGWQLKHGNLQRIGASEPRNVTRNNAVPKDVLVPARQTPKTSMPP